MYSMYFHIFSYIFAAALILFAITSFFMVKGKYGIKGRGGIYTLIGILIPLLFLLYFITVMLCSW